MTATLETVLTEAISDGFGYCVYEFCKGPDVEPEGMVTCWRCWLLHDLRKAMATPDEPAELWANDLVQFSRLLAEIVATQSLDVPALCESMDLEPDDIDELLERAHVQWEHAKATLT